ncbi:MAG: SpoIIE family protein phosphatase, partial [Bacteroidales bacterium]|nr:SpoIIE family protein phosphatase [Bacteroidales bacterium]
ATPGALIFYFILGIVIVFSLIRLYTRRIRNENRRLQHLTRHKTDEVVSQKDELEAGIHYASRIQKALLPSEKLLADHNTNYFILFKPRDVVSGDFYWMTRKEERLYLVAADCTGHGVPGAFMSLLGISLLDEIINKMSVRKPGDILNELRKQVIDSLKQSGETDEGRDVIDVALLVFDFERRTVEFSGANNPCFKVRPMNEDEVEKWEKGEIETDEGTMANGKYLLETVNASKMPVGISSKMNQDFMQREWPMERDISYYLFTDGYIDQFNGTTGRKFMKKNFKKLILEVQDYPMKKQKEILDERLKSWMGSSRQVDDILVIGFKAD